MLNSCLLKASSIMNVYENYTNFSLAFSFDYYTEKSVKDPSSYHDNKSGISSENVTVLYAEIPVIPKESQWIYGWTDSIYPSGYSQLRIVVTAFFVTCIMVIIVVGNMLVCIAIATEKALKTVQNWFIASLAVSDFLVGLVIMPFSLANELMGYWIFGPLWCEIHAALDVLMCTASINNLCLISLDRYWSVTQAVEYLKKRTQSRAIAMICFVWLLSALISLPPLLGWKKPERPTDYPTCTLSDDVGYVLYSALGSFYLPCLVMVFVYIRIFMAARSRARRHVKKQRHAPEVTNDPPRDKSTTTTTCTSFSNPSPPDKHRDSDLFTTVESRHLNGSHSKRDSPSTPVAAPEIIIETSNENSAECSERMCPSFQVDEVEQNEMQILGNSTSGTTDEDLIPSDSSKADDSLLTPSVKAVLPENRAVFLSAPRTVFGSSLCLADCKDRDVNELNDSKNFTKLRRKRKPRPLRQHLPARPLQSDTEKQKRRIARARERRATLILGLIMIAFILAWLPFFVLYVLEALCSPCHIGETAFAIAFWLGYCNSALNPIIYTIFNRDFRRAFKKILFK